MRVLLAPMEGVLDSLVRELLTEVNDYDLCITEFLRVVDQCLPVKSFYRLCPELQHASRTPSGTLVRVQLLGQYPQWLAENAARAVELGSYGVDLNCGCPSKLVNGSGGGATLLKDPELIYRGAKAMREAVPAHLPVTVKIRLGWDSGARQFEIADAVQQAGASELAVHGRTKEDGYKAECINWQAIGEIRQRLRIPVIANGEIWDWQSAQDCMATTGCDAVMIGRGALNVPNLSRVIKYNEPRMPWPEVMLLLQKYVQLEKQGDTGLYHVARIKQWLGYLRKEYDDATELFSEIRTLKTSADIARVIGEP
ncbi:MULTISPECIES: tRNA dihydrouridine(16) synthase DusC [Pectobacterium]|uniref:tRNA-dihydrouridine(16) synthase n=1 Tax=Pectobacterium carotovorum subsp. carotovorum TaxID=555 RepID=A0AA40IZU7_PECCC|nr:MULTISPECIES: tRNA dihydrouridine(16) synthase DusC [Pectobacterium]KFW97725.1 tRNA-dihydrouridine synthase C [Pectobacterium carotovorum subsp. carotovorum]KHT21691.1 tRNA-dihydrouridine synthase C [Pectobacterium carotovorum subsp. carotovorum]KHT33393.1 tRNA-dihydrouridine synthase C [Pectobacterium carotovorum subsp. carotovorum]KML68710.1 tRNA-dihydrouridine synthase C [Pectobacterium carotovorum subsp. carotovorum ICMP 5702]MBA0174743.1 tRNA dihydrouridine(16) synthase DusC [Pectobact